MTDDKATKAATNQQRLQLEKLMSDVAKPVVIPEPAKLKAPPKPAEFNFDVMGSSAGAGSGEFHIYRGIRRREMNRQEWIESEAKKDELDDEFRKRQAERQKEDDARTAKKRAKRLKRKEKKKTSGVVDVAKGNEKKKVKTSSKEESSDEED